MAFHSDRVTGWMERRAPRFKTTIFSSPGTRSNRLNEIISLHARTNLTSTTYQIGFWGVLFGS